MTHRAKLFACAVLLAFAPVASAMADTQLEVGPSVVLTDQSPDADRSAKIEILRLGNGEEPSLTVAGCAVRGVHARNDLNGALLVLMAVALMYRRRSKKLRVKEFSHDQAQND